MAEFFGVDENELCAGLKDVLRQIEEQKLQRDKGGEPAIIGRQPGACIGHYNRGLLDIEASLPPSAPGVRIDVVMRITFS